MQFYRFLTLAASILIIANDCTAGIFDKKSKKADTQARQLPIVYDKGYGMGPIGTQWLINMVHPFDTAKASKVAAHLKAAHWALTPAGSEITHQELREVHTPEYLASLEKHTAREVAEIVGIPPLAKLPNWFVDRYVLAPMRRQAAGTLVAARLALKHGWAINLGGGFHHAKPASGEGFCVYGDIQLTAKRYLDEHPEHKVMIVDLDAHRGNGFAQALLDEPRVVIFDVYGGNNYPQHDRQLCDRIDFNFPLEIGRGTKVDDALYLGILKRSLGAAIEAAKPDFIIYNAGTDILVGDQLGGMKVSAHGVVARDAMVFQEALSRKIPIVMVTSGGYTDASSKVIADSIDNLLVLMGQNKA
jgi:histone deacetylase 11